MELDGTAPSSCLFASKRSYSIGFKDYPCLLGLTRLTYCQLPPLCS
nr:MAG TPA: hypothetical protein [Caudoviricetes sp.]